MKHLEKLVGRIAALALLLMMLVVLIDVIGRGLLNAPLASGTELTEILMAVMAFVAFPLLAYRQRDITVDLFDSLGGEGLRKYQVGLAGLCGAVVFALTASQLAVFAKRALTNGEISSELHFPLTYLWWFMSFMAALTALAALAVAIRAFSANPVPVAQAQAMD
jgi:TRAP-type C4-dicarboxylate transport system permease small subunit